MYFLEENRALFTNKPLELWGGGGGGCGGGGGGGGWGGGGGAKKTLISKPNKDRESFIIQEQSAQAIGA